MATRSTWPKEQLTAVSKGAKTFPAPKRKRLCGSRSTSLRMQGASQSSRCTAENVTRDSEKWVTRRNGHQGKARHQGASGEVEWRRFPFRQACLRRGETHRESSRGGARWH